MSNETDFYSIITTEVVSALTEMLENAAEIKTDLQLSNPEYAASQETKTGIGSVMEDMGISLENVLNNVNGYLRGIGNFSLPNILSGIFGSIFAPFQIIGNIINLFWDALTQVITEAFVAGKFFFELVEDIVQEAIVGFQDSRIGVLPGSLIQRPNTKYPLYPSESDVNRVSRRDDTVFQPGGMKYEYDARRDHLIEDPEMEYDATYPYNHYWMSESGHVREWDDTPGYERTQEHHRTGTGWHINPDGAKRATVVGHNYEVYVKDNRVHVRGNVEIYVDQDSNVSINGESNIKVGRSATIQCGANATITAGETASISAKNVNISACEDISIRAAGLLSLSGDTVTIDGQNVLIHSGEMDLHATGEIDIAASHIHENDNNPIAPNSPKPLCPAPPPLHNVVEFKPYVYDIRHEDNVESVSRIKAEDVKVGMEKGEINSTKQIGLNKDVIVPTAKDETETPKQTPKDESISVNTSNKNLNNTNDNIYDTKISKYFYLRDVTLSPTVSSQKYLRAQCGDSVETIIKNLSNLASVGLDRLYEMFNGCTFTTYGRKKGRLQLNSVYRYPGDSDTRCNGDHPHGCAADIQIVGLGYPEYYDLAVKLKNELTGWDKILLEYSTANTAWIHISISRQHARGMTFTYYNHRKNSNGFVNLLAGKKPKLTA